MMSCISFVDALFKRYADTRIRNELDCEIFVVGSFSPGKSGNNLILPPSLSLNRCDIRFAGCEEKIKKFCGNVVQLDLASNGFNEFTEVFKIVKEMPNLRFLNLSENDFSDAAINESQIHKLDHLNQLRSLVLNNTRVPWSAVDTLLDAMPSIQDLHLSLNNYSSIDINSNKHNGVKHLYVSGNPNLSNWAEIEKLVEAFPDLEALTMADCNISSFPQNLEQILPRIQSINISNWPIKSWECLERLNKLPNLFELRCLGLHLLQELNSLDCRRHHLIARLPNIQRLNGSEVTSDERIHAEKAFVRWYLSNEQVAKPARFHALQAAHGRIVPLAEVDLSPPKHAHVKVVYSENECDPENNNSDNDSAKMQIKSMKLDLNKSVKDFKLELSSIFGVPLSQMRLYYIDHVMAEITGPEELRINQKKLYTYNIQDEDEFLVALK